MQIRLKISTCGYVPDDVTRAHETQIKNVQIVQIIGKQYAIHFIMLTLTSTNS